MSAPMIWVVTPAVMAVALLMVRRTRTAARLGATGATVLALLAWRAPIDQPIPLVGDWGVRIAPRMHVLGRQLVLTDAARPWLTWLFLGMAVWLLGAAVARMEPTFVGLALGFVTILVAAVAIRPFVYAALLVETAALIAVPLLVPPETYPGRGVLRFLTFQTVGMLFILLVGWMLVGTETGLPGSALVLRGEVLLGVGFALLLGVFPFHSWMPMLAEEIHPYAAAFVLLTVTSVVAILGVGFLERYTWLRQSPQVFWGLQALGGGMVAIGGILAAFQRHAGRVLGYAVMMEVGWSLFALGGGGPQGVALFFALWAGRAVLFALWATALSGLGRRRDGLTYRSLRGLGTEFPLLTWGAVLAPLGLAGMPWLGSFPTRLALWQAAATSGWMLLALTVGSIGLIASGCRLLGALVVDEQDRPWEVKEHFDEGGWMVFLLSLAVLIGPFPQWWWKYAQAMARWFPHLVR